MTRPKAAPAEKPTREERQIAVFVRADLKTGLAAAALAEKRSQKAVLEDALATYFALRAGADLTAAPAASRSS